MEVWGCMCVYCDVYVCMWTLRGRLYMFHPASDRIKWSNNCIARSANSKSGPNTDPIRTRRYNIIQCQKQPYDQMRMHLVINCRWFHAEEKLGSPTLRAIVSARAHRYPCNASYTTYRVCVNEHLHIIHFLRFNTYTLLAHCTSA